MPKHIILIVHVFELSKSDFILYVVLYDLFLLLLINIVILRIIYIVNYSYSFFFTTVLNSIL